MMSRLSQVINHNRVRTKKQQSSLNSSQKKAVCVKVTTISPKKPNSANRRVVKANILLYNKPRNLTIKIPGEGHNIQQHSTILIRCGRIRDLIGVNTLAVRGKLDLVGVLNRKSSRSVYGVKKNTA